MPPEIAPLRRTILTFKSRFLTIALLAAVSFGGCSSTNGDQGGAGGRTTGAGGGSGAGGRAGSPGGAAGVPTGGSGGKAGAGGAACGHWQFMHEITGECLPPSDPLFRCAPTYDEQATVTACSGLGQQTIVKGSCGSGWAWDCRTGATDWICIYDGRKNLVKASSCGESTCDYSSEVSTDGGRACDISELHGS
jgi:hypothetical protein